MCVCLKCLAAVRWAASLICADSFVIGALHNEGGDLQLIVHPQSERWRNNGRVEDGCVCVAAEVPGIGGSSGPVTEATASLSGSIHSIPACSPTPFGQNQLSAFLNGFQRQP